MPKKNQSKPAQNIETAEIKEKISQDIKRKYIQLQMLKQYIAAMAEEKNLLEAKLAEISITINAIEKISKTRKGQEILSSLGSEAFAISDIRDTENIIVGIGAGIFITAPTQRAIEIMKSRSKEMSNLNQQITEEINGIANEAMNLEKELQKEISKAKERGNE